MRSRNKKLEWPVTYVQALGCVQKVSIGLVYHKFQKRDILFTQRQQKQTEIDVQVLDIIFRRILRQDILF
jgi:hypothetical protein